MEYVITAALAYLIGAFPTGAVLGRLYGKVDLTAVGSGSTGATNTSRTLGMGAGVFVLLGDFGKGALATYLATQFVGTPAAIGIAAVLPVIGHTHSIFLGGRGGRGVMTGLGGLAIAVTGVFIPAALTGCVVAAASRYISLGSICGATVAFLGGVVGYLSGQTSIEISLAAVAIGLLVLVAHRENMDRLRAGTERRLGDHTGALPR